MLYFIVNRVAENDSDRQQTFYYYKILRMHKEIKTWTHVIFSAR